MEGMIAGRTASEMPGLDIAEQRSWQNFLDSALRMYATLNRSLVDAHHLTLNDVRLLDMLDKSATGSARMGDLADEHVSGAVRGGRPDQPKITDVPPDQRKPVSAAYGQELITQRGVFGDARVINQDVDLRKGFERFLLELFYIGFFSGVGGNRHRFNAQLAALIDQ